MILLCAFPSPKLRWNETVFVSLLLLLRPLLSLAIFVLCVFYLYPISINKTVICIYIKAFESPFYFWSTATFFAFSLPQRNSNNTWAWFVQKISGCRTYFRLFEHFFFADCGLSVVDQRALEQVLLCSGHTRPLLFAFRNETFLSWTWKGVNMCPVFRFPPTKLNIKQNDSLWHQKARSAFWKCWCWAAKINWWNLFGCLSSRCSNIWYSS